MSANIITRFCSLDYPEWMRKPFRLGGYLYATNGHVAIRMNDDLTIDAESEGIDKASKVVALFEKSVSIERKWIAVPTAIDGKLCCNCHGSGFVSTCQDCDGEGEFDHGRHTYRCNECDGSGDVAATFGKQCPNCLGTKIDSWDGLDVAHAHYAKRYLKLIGDAFPGAEIGVPDDERGAAMWRADGVLGFLMPMRRLS